MTHVKQKQVNDLKNGLKDIRYNFLIGINEIIEGRGWDVKPELSLQDSVSIGFFTDSLQSWKNFNSSYMKFLSDGIIIGMLADHIQIICDVPLCVDPLF